MLRNAKDLHGFTIRATDGELGTVDQFYFDDESWAIRYLTVETGGVARRSAGADLADLRDWRAGLASQAIGCDANEKAGGE